MFHQKLTSLRKRAGLSQEKLAEILDVTRQAVQKWEHGTTMPDIAKLISIGELFGVSIDFLLNTCEPDPDEFRHEATISPQYGALHPWEAYYAELPLELRQSYEEGRDVKRYEKLAAEIDHLVPDVHKKQMADAFYEIIEASPQRSNYHYVEPSDYAHIALLCNPPQTQPAPEDSILNAKLRGAWEGRICGCLLGKPLEGIKLNELIPFLKESGNYPMHRYLLSSDITDRVKEKYAFSFISCCAADQICSAPSDDDTNYTALALCLLEKYGRNFTSENVATLWVDSQVKNAYCTAERVAYRNIVNGYCPPDTATWRNPYREWIGAQIRADFYGYINPGNPRAAAEMAWRDARISHVKNGIYGSMFVAAMLAQAAVCSDAEQVIEAGLSCIPFTSRLHETILGILKDYRSGVEKNICIQKIQEQFDDCSPHDWCHTISNAAIVTVSLLYGELDYGKTICLAVECGFDTDCNGATAGSILGMMLGENGIDSSWTAPIHNKLRTTIFGVGTITIDELVKRTKVHVVS